MKRSKIIKGGIYKIPINSIYFTYGIYRDGTISVLDCLCKSDDLKLEEIIKHKILFTIYVFDGIFKKGIWTLVGTTILDENFSKDPPMFHLSIGSDPEEYSIYENGSFRPANKEQCIGLEEFAIWSDCHVIDRLKDYYGDLIDNE